MSEPYKVLPTPCKSCPWQVNATATDIPRFQLQLAESLATTCPDERGFGPDVFAPQFACHQSREGDEFACAGWLAVVGHRHPAVRLAVAQGRLSVEALEPQKDWPELHGSYFEMMEKLRLR
jgi:hypothetical protein